MREEGEREERRGFLASLESHHAGNCLLHPQAAPSPKANFLPSQHPLSPPPVLTLSPLCTHPLCPHMHMHSLGPSNLLCRRPKGQAAAGREGGMEGKGEKGSGGRQAQVVERTSQLLTPIRHWGSSSFHHRPTLPQANSIALSEPPAQPHLTLPTSTSPWQLEPFCFGLGVIRPVHPSQCLLAPPPNRTNLAVAPWTCRNEGSVGRTTAGASSPASAPT